MSKNYYSLGLMSGTSGDGVDASLINSDGDSNYKVEINKFFEYDEAFHHQIAITSKLHLNRVRCITKDDNLWNGSILDEHKNILKAIKMK